MPRIRTTARHILSAVAVANVVIASSSIALAQSPPCNGFWVEWRGGVDFGAITIDVLTGPLNPTTPNGVVVPVAVSYPQPPCQFPPCSTWVSLPSPYQNRIVVAGGIPGTFSIGGKVIPMGNGGMPGGYELIQITVNGKPRCFRAWWEQVGDCYKLVIQEWQCDPLCDEYTINVTGEEWGPATTNFSVTEINTLGQSSSLTVPTFGYGLNQSLPSNLGGIAAVNIGGSSYYGPGTHVFTRNVGLHQIEWVS